MLQLLARVPLFSRENLQHSSRGRGGAPPRPPTPLGSNHAGGILATSVPLVSAKLVAVSFFYRVVDVAILELLYFFILYQSD